jgi:hypothetical protein
MLDGIFLEAPQQPDEICALLHPPPRSGELRQGSIHRGQKEIAFGPVHCRRENGQALGGDQNATVEQQPVEKANLAAVFDEAGGVAIVVQWFPAE